uniref:Bromo domain-containing protein n=1 Tax=Schistocephalus solidus TaxID=70667 RepID=A0A0V0J9E3_SCHSO
METAPSNSVLTPDSTTLEALLDAPGPLSLSQGSRSGVKASPIWPNGQNPPCEDTTSSPSTKRKLSSVSDSTVLHHPPTDKPVVDITLKEACMELLCILIRQDVNGLLHFPLKQVDGFQNSLRGLERLVLTDKVHSLDDFRQRVESIFTTARDYYPASMPAGSEVARLSSLASQWFSSLAGHPIWSVRWPHPQPLSTPVSVPEDSPCEVSLRILNPDNRGIVSPTKRIRTIGQEVGTLTEGTHLSQFGGYREDRRNKVIPYTYLNYGPYASFGPTYDSGTSNCTPESNQLLLGTSWLPARLVYLDYDEEGEVSTGAAEEAADAPNKTTEGDTSYLGHLARTAEKLGDTELAAALADSEAEWRQGLQLAEELEDIIPPIGFGDDFSLYLANTLTRNMPPPPASSTESDGSDDDDVTDIRVGESEAVVMLSSSGETIAPSCDVPAESASDKTAAEGSALATRELAITSGLLSESARKLRRLYNAQYRRLGDYSPQSLNGECSLRPSRVELQSAYSLVNDLVSLVATVPPGAVVSRQAIRRQLGVCDLPLVEVDVQNPE